MNNNGDYQSTEKSLIAARAVVMIYNVEEQCWTFSNSSTAVSNVHIFKHLINKSFRVVGRSCLNREVTINSMITSELRYNQATETFHQFRDNNQAVYGLNFESIDDANNFAQHMLQALKSLEVVAVQSTPQPPAEVIEHQEVMSPKTSTTADKPTKLKPIPKSKEHLSKTHPIPGSQTIPAPPPPPPPPPPISSLPHTSLNYKPGVQSSKDSPRGQDSSQHPKLDLANEIKNAKLKKTKPEDDECNGWTSATYTTPNHERNGWTTGTYSTLDQQRNGWTTATHITPESSSRLTTMPPPAPVKSDSVMSDLSRKLNERRHKAEAQAPPANCDPVLPRHKAEAQAPPANCDPVLPRHKAEAQAPPANCDPVLPRHKAEAQAPPANSDPVLPQNPGYSSTNFPNSERVRKSSKQLPETFTTESLSFTTTELIDNQTSSKDGTDFPSNTTASKTCEVAVSHVSIRSSNQDQPQQSVTSSPTHQDKTCNCSAELREAILQEIRLEFQQMKKDIIQTMKLEIYQQLTTLR